MVDWLSPHVLHVSAQYAQKVNTFLFGLYSWHFLSTLNHVEIPLLMRKLRFRWTLLPYLGARYSLLAATIGFELNLCGPANETLWFLGCMAVVFASESIMLRAMTLWRGNLWATATLAAMALGHWAVGITVFFVPAVDAWLQYDKTCEIVTGAGGPVPFYVYTLIFDLAILLFTVFGLLRIREASSSPLWVHLYKQGLGYFVITFLINVLTLAFALMKLNVYVGDIFSAPGVTVSVIVSSQAVVSLLEMNEARENDPSGTKGSESIKSPSRAFSTNVMLTMSVTSNEILESVALRSPARATFLAPSPNVDDTPCPGSAPRITHGIDVQITPVSRLREAVGDSPV